MASLRKYNLIRDVQRPVLSRYFDQGMTGKVLANNTLIEKASEEAKVSKQTVKNACSPNPCQNGGQCTIKDEGANYVCTCPFFNIYGRNCHLYKCVLFDFETGRLDGWTLTGTAFNNQPTYADNSAIRIGNSSKLRGDWYIGTQENRPTPSHPAGGYQGNGPTGTATSPPFVIRGTKLRLLIGGGSDINTEYVELLIGGSVVAKVGNSVNDETMAQKEIDVTSKRGQVAQVRIVDNSAVTWGLIIVDHIEDNCSE